MATNKFQLSSTQNHLFSCQFSIFMIPRADYSQIWFPLDNYPHDLMPTSPLDKLCINFIHYLQLEWIKKSKNLIPVKIKLSSTFPLFDVTWKKACYQIFFIYLAFKTHSHNMNVPNLLLDIPCENTIYRFNICDNNHVSALFKNIVAHVKRHMYLTRSLIITLSVSIISGSLKSNIDLIHS